MKSYFAKLAARATLANTAAPAATSKIHDPFVEEAVSDNAPSPRELAQPSHGPTEPVRTTRDQPLTQKAEPVLSRTETVDSDTSHDKEARSRSVTEPVHLKPTVDRDVEVTSDTETQQPQLRREPQELKPDTANKAPQVVSEEETVSRLAPPPIPTETPRSKSSDADTDQTLEEIKREQAVLLRKADAFMAGLFEHRSSHATQREADSQDEKPARSHAEVSPVTPARLLPLKAPQVIETADEQPSLVIGKLTVEVTSPTPPPVNPTPRIVVVRGPGTGRRHGGFQSSQRFGLGQF